LIRIFFGEEGTPEVCRKIFDILSMTQREMIMKVAEDRPQ